MLRCLGLQSTTPVRLPERLDAINEGWWSAMDQAFAHMCVAASTLRVHECCSCAGGGDVVTTTALAIAIRRSAAHSQQQFYLCILPFRPTLHDAYQGLASTMCPWRDMRLAIVFLCTGGARATGSCIPASLPTSRRLQLLHTIASFAKVIDGHPSCNHEL